MVLAACVPTVQRAGSPLDGFTGPRFEPVAPVVRAALVAGVRQRPERGAP